VREDVAAQLRLREPAVLVGDFFRPNLHYRAVPRAHAFGDAEELVSRRPGQAGIVYCIRRADVDTLAARLKADGVRAEAYHAGLDDDERTRVQDRFAAGEAEVIVATVAFGMGIDRADIRYVIHAAMPKSLEHYQQETGRAGRDGRPADCVLLYSGGDYGLWRQIIETSETADRDQKMRMLSDMYAFCRRERCRHRALVEYFGQAWARSSCGSCDVCTTERPALSDGAEVARAILRGVAQTGQRFGAAYVADVLWGERTDRVRQNRHEGLDVCGALASRPKEAVRAWIDQLADQDLLRREGDYAVLKLTPAGWSVVKGEAAARRFEARRGPGALAR
jgi:ATP-dependent DNA helicase RecQ